jgi:hypothetical protein
LSKISVPRGHVVLDLSCGVYDGCNSHYASSVRISPGLQAARQIAGIESAPSQGHSTFYAISRSN